VVAVLVGVGSVVMVVVVMCHTSTPGSAGCDGGIVSVSSSSSEACNFAIAFCVRSGNSPDQVSAQFCSMQVSCVLIFSTVFISSSVSADDVVGFLLAAVREVVAVVVPILLLAIGLVAARAFLAAFFQMSFMMTVREIVSNGSTSRVLKVSVLGSWFW
jgi:hypothetical protein